MLLGLAALALVAAGLVAAYLLTHRDSGGTATTVVVTTAPATTGVSGRVAVPYLVGLTEQRAIERLTQVGLKPKAVLRRTKGTGRVVSQQPRTGIDVERGRTVTIVVDAGSQAGITAPSLVGQSLAAAQVKLSSLGLRAVTTPVASTQPAGTVVDQAPKPGTKLQKGWVVVLSVARGSNTTTAPETTTAGSTTAPTTTAQPAPQPSSATMPDVSQQTEQSAVTTMNRAGILASLFFVPSDDALGTVEQQAKPAGTTLPYHSHVQINISAGPGGKPSMQVPNLVGRTLQDAVSALNGAGLRLIYVKFPVTSGRVGVVVQQSPLAGGHAPKNAQVLVFLAVKGS
jgi:beta-lactam-binding protein with PASTA domain